MKSLKKFSFALCVTFILLLFVSCSQDVERNLKLLDSKDAEVRLKAIRKLGDIGDQRAVEPLIEIATNKDEKIDVRGEAVIALGKIGDARAVLPLEQLKNHLLNEEVKAAITLINNKDANSLLAALKEKDKRVYLSAIRMMVDIGDRRSKLALEQLAKENENSDVSSFARVGVFAIKQDIDSLLTALKHGDENTQDVWVPYALGKIGEPAVDPLMELFTSGKHELVSDALTMIGEPAVKPLITILKDKKNSDDIRKRAIRILGLIGNERVIEPIINAARTDTVMRGHAASALGRFDYKEISTKPAVDILIKFLKDKDSSVRLSAVKSLGNIGDERAVESLITAHKDEDSDVRHYAAIALGRICSKRRINEAVEVMLKNLKSDDTNVVYWAIQALEKIGDKRALPMLEWIAIGDDREYLNVHPLRGIAKQAFEEISGHPLKSFDLTSFDTFEDFKSLKGGILWVRSRLRLGYFNWKVDVIDFTGKEISLDERLSIFRRKERFYVLDVEVSKDDRRVSLTISVKKASGKKFDIFFLSRSERSSVQNLAFTISRVFIVII